MDEYKVRQFLDPQYHFGGSGVATVGEVDEAFGSGPEELSRKRPWITAKKQGMQVFRWKDGDTIILACGEYSSSMEMFCYSSTASTGGRVSESKGSVRSKSQVTRENFDTLTVGMLRSQIEDRLGFGSRLSYSERDKEFTAALGALPGDEKERWINALNESKVDVFSDRAGTRILVAYGARPEDYKPESKAVAIYYTWTGLVDRERILAKKGNLGPPAPAPVKP
jgi:hypothetical protein